MTAINVLQLVAFKAMSPTQFSSFLSLSQTPGSHTIVSGHLHRIPDTCRILTSVCGIICSSISEWTAYLRNVLVSTQIIA